MGGGHAGLLSVVVPVYNEEQNVLELRARLSAALTGRDFECIFVNDGSTDATADIIRRIAREDARFKQVSLSRNFGQQAAIAAGLAHAGGACVAVIDGDLQDPPELLPEMARIWSEGTDVVYGVRTHRKEGPLKRAAYCAFYYLLNRVAPVEIPRDAGDFAVMDRRVVDLIISMSERHPYLRGLRSWVGFRQVAFPYVRAARHSGRPKYTLRKLMDLAVIGIVSFSYAPLRLAALAGAAISLLALSAGALFLLHWLSGLRLFGYRPEDVPGIAGVFVAVALLFGIQLLILGALGEYVSRIFDEVRNRPLYVVDELVGLDPTYAGASWARARKIAGRSSPNVPD